MRFLAVFLAAVSVVTAQQAISARSGMVNFASQGFQIADREITPVQGQFPEVKAGQTLASSEGRVEVLLNPGIFLRLDPNSSFRMIDSSLTDAHLELVSGRGLVEVVEVMKENKVTIHVGKAALVPEKMGVYLIDADAKEVKVFEGSIEATLNDASLDITKGKMSSLSSLVATKFDRNSDFDLYAWSETRSGEIAAANLTIASSIGQRRAQPVKIAGSWRLYPQLGFFTYLPSGGRRIRNPFGLYYYSPNYLWGYYNQRYYAQQSAAAYAAENSNWGGRSAATVNAAPAAAVAASTGDIPRATATAAPAAGAGATGRGR